MTNATAARTTLECGSGPHPSDIAWLRQINTAECLPQLPALFPTTTVAAAVAAVVTAVCLTRTRFVDIQRAPVQVLPIESRHRLTGFSSVGHFDEAEPAGLPAVAVADHARSFDGSIRAECRV